MISYKNDRRKKLPYPSFISCLLRDDPVLSVDTLLTIASESSGPDEKAVQKMPFVKDSNGHWYYDDKLYPGTWYYDFVTVLEGTHPTLVKQMKENMEKEDSDFENDADMEDVEEETSDVEDFDYDPDDDEDVQGSNQNHPMVDLSEVLNGMKDLKRFMTQNFDAQDLQFQEVNKRFDTQEAQIQEMRESVQKGEDLGCSTDAFLPLLG